jgi:hypothetical protein
MARERKTRDTWQLHVNYGQGWEHEVTEFTYREAREQRKCYRENVPQYPVKLVFKRERIEPETHWSDSPLETGIA